LDKNNVNTTLTKGTEMQKLSLHTKLRSLLELGSLHLRQDPDLGHVLTGEGSYYMGDDKVEILANFHGTLPGDADITFSAPSDVAWIPRTGVIVAFALAEDEPFEIMPAPLRDVVSKFKQKQSSSLN
jgi:hypothetical protein